MVYFFASNLMMTFCVIQSYSPVTIRTDYDTVDFDFLIIFLKILFEWFHIFLVNFTF